MPATILLITALFVLLAATIFVFVATRADAVEGLGLIRSIARSVNLVRSSFFRIIGPDLALFLVIVAAGAAPILLSKWTGIELTPAHYRIPVWPDRLFTLHFVAVVAVVCTVTHRGLRVSREGPDLARVAADWTEPSRGGGRR